MPDFPFLYVCDLLDDLERLRDPTRRLVVSRELSRLTTEEFIAWSKSHCARLNACYLEDDAVGRTLRPENSTDRVNGLDAEKLEHVVARVLMLPAAQAIELRKWREGPAHGDLGACVARVVENMSTANPLRALTNLVTVQEIDQGLLKLSAFNPRSSAAVRSLARHIPCIDQLSIIENLYLRMQHREAKWLTRLILKAYAPIVIPESPEIAACHSGLPNMLCLKAEVGRPKGVPMLRNAYSGWIRGVDPADENSNLTLTLPTTTPPEQALPMSNSYAQNAEQAQPILRDNAPPTPPSSSPTAIPTSARTLKVTPISPTKNPQPTPSMQLVIPGTPRQHTSRKRSLNSLPQPPGPPKFSSSRTSHPASSEDESVTTVPHPLPFTYAGTGICRANCQTQTCPLTNCIIVLAPHVSAQPRLTEYLLPLHGCRYTTSPLSLSSLDSLSINPSPEPVSTKNKIRKIALVDSHHTEAAVDFMKVIRALDLRRHRENGGGRDEGKSLGKKDWVEVYDWRLLEMLNRAEGGHRKGRDTSVPWRRCWIGAV